MTRPIAFDFDGTIMNTKSAYVEMLVQAFENHGVDITREEVSNALVPSIKGTIEWLLARHKRSESKLAEKLETSTITLLSTQWMENISPTDKINELLDIFFDNDIELYIVSNSHSSFVLPALAKFKLGKYFRDVITLDSGFNDKIDMLEALAKRTGLHITELLYIADTMMDIEVAEKLGCELMVLLTPSSWDYDKRIQLALAVDGNKQISIVNNVHEAQNLLFGI
jgi:phosphoglycolate phosphatase-like HAD superfamily hydrolase